ncbi:hypothetical protein PUNSTDRAFT_107391 [Punctularia strigosozonata HHB-11173 SS5]|uniref:Oxidase ustYa n=1 Tax=Punctularia strigosozonata (strain HHB-11173) TaxID=741275 RepID=R7S3Y3_PUNST|nr:uncharacterized protein PUNSTDRAFT_107391 [Punctularia strigosozonata HHB-11173 SS5]EIN05095.1 hypothetical protein PUNSTDRAFT_107391 [Punctularia strigosozonata HHB-11173 SS5]
MPTQMAHFIVLLILALNISMMLRVVLRSMNAKLSMHKYSYVGEDYPLWYPIEVGPVAMTFEETGRFALQGPVADAEWDTLRVINTHEGFVRLGPDNRMFSVAMFHELHCVSDVFRVALVDAEDPRAKEHHFQHCLNYLRQLFLCSADATLEPYDFMERDFERDRGGFTRECRDWSAVYEASARNWDWWEEYKLTHRTRPSTFPTS